MEAAMTRHVTGMVLGALLASASATAAWAHHATMLPVDQLVDVGDTTAVCTGVGLDTREDPRWREFPLRVEIAGKDGQYLGDAVVEVKGAHVDGELALRCSGPWVLVDLPSGTYQVTVHAGHDGPMRTATVNIGTAQKRLVMHFPNAGGETTQQIFAIEGY
jgi:hypothetical protein